MIAKLRSVPQLRSVSPQDLSPIQSGTEDVKKFKLRHQDLDLFVKDIADNERVVHERLQELDLRHVPRVFFPELLSENVLVCEFVAGPRCSSPILEDSLIVEYARIQNHLGTAEPAEVYSKARDFFRGAVFHKIEKGKENIAQLPMQERGKFAPLLEIVAAVEKKREWTEAAFDQVPFGWAHNDFREANILQSDRQMIVDWGSSYGLQPFLDDLAPFLIVTPEKLDLFSKHSALGQRRSREEMLQWLALSAFAKFAGFFVYVFDIQKESGVPWDTFLDYHTAKFKSITWIP